MNKLFLLFVLPLLSISQNNDDFTFNHNGVENYIVIEVDSLSTNELYKKAKTVVFDKLNVKDRSVMTDLESQVFTIKAGDLENFGGKRMKGFKTTIVYDLEMRFKEGRVRIDVNNLKLLQGSLKSDVAGIGSWGAPKLYNKKRDQIIPTNKVSAQIIIDVKEYLIKLGDKLKELFNSSNLNDW